MSFDAYKQWLGIPLQELPAHYYRLLGVQIFEANPSVIDNAADRQMAHLRSFQSGPRSELADQLLNEVSAARICLLDQAKKAAYDSQLKANLSLLKPVVPATAPPAASPEATLPSTPEPQAEVPPKVIESSPFQVATASVPPQGKANRASSARPPSARPPSTRRRKTKNPVFEMVKIVLGGVAGILIALIIGGFGFGVGPLASSDSDDTSEANSSQRLERGKSRKDRDAEKSARLESVQSRVSPREQVAKHRFSDEADPQETQEQGSGNDSDESEGPPLSAIMKEPFAEVLSMTGGQYEPLQVNAPYTTDSRFVWSSVVPELEGFHFLRNEYQQATTDFEIKNSGVVLMAVCAQWRAGESGEMQEDLEMRKDLQADGWAKAGELDTHHINSFGDVRTFAIYAKSCQKGESFSYRASKDVAPVLILK